MFKDSQCWSIYGSGFYCYCIIFTSLIWIFWYHIIFVNDMSSKEMYIFLSFICSFHSVFLNDKKLLWGLMHFWFTIPQNYIWMEMGFFCLPTKTFIKTLKSMKSTELRIWSLKTYFWYYFSMFKNTKISVRLLRQIVKFHEF